MCHGFSHCLMLQSGVGNRESRFVASARIHPWLGSGGLGWLLAFALAFALDRPVAQWVHDSVPVHKEAPVTHRVLNVLKLPGYFPATLCVAALLGIFHKRHWVAAIPLALSGVFVGIIYSVLKWVAGRHRPVKGIHPWSFHPFPRGIHGLWKGRSGFCFPSGHASLGVCLGDVPDAVAAALGSFILYHCNGYRCRARAGERALSQRRGGRGGAWNFGRLVDYPRDVVGVRNASIGAPGLDV